MTEAYGQADYEPYVGRWSWLVAREFLTWLATLPSADGWMSDVAPER